MQNDSLAQNNEEQHEELMIGEVSDLKPISEDEDLSGAALNLVTQAIELSQSYEIERANVLHS